MLLVEFEVLGYYKTILLMFIFFGVINGVFVIDVFVSKANLFSIEED